MVYISWDKHGNWCGHDWCEDMRKNISGDNEGFKAAKSDDDVGTWFSQLPKLRDSSPANPLYIHLLHVRCLYERLVLDILGV